MHTEYLYKKYRLAFLVLILLSALSFSSRLNAQDNITISIQEGQNIRDIAEQYLNNSNLWEDILRANNLNSPADIEPGLKLRIPVKSIKENLEALNSALDAIKQASMEGAKIFAEELVAEANNNYEEAVKKNELGDRKESTRLAKSAKDLADQAIIEAQKNSNTTGTALLSYKKGDVENKKPAELIWNDAELYAMLFERDRTRTLSSSYAEISFKDLSKIRLYENSQAVIQSSRVNLLKNQKKASVNLEKGEAYALLLGNGKKKDFNLKIPGIKTNIDSKLFWVQKETKKTRIANYNGEIEVTANDSMVVIKENEGSEIPDGGVPSKPKSLLPIPNLLTPEFEKTFYKTKLEFNWASVDGAESYSFILSNDKSFETVVNSSKELKDTKYSVSNLKSGTYYWQVAAIDDFGFPGPFSDKGIFIIHIDDVPPFITLSSPKELSAHKDNSINIIGDTEKEAEIFVNNKKIPVDDNGDFNTKVNLNDGLNNIVVIAKDLAGNESKIERKIIHEADPNIKITYSENLSFDNDKNLIVSSTSLSFSGKTRSNSLVKLTSQSYKLNLETYAESNGSFQFLIGGINSDGEFNLYVTSPAGYTKQETIKCVYKSETPEIKFTDEIPASTSKESFLISGSIIQADVLAISGENIVIESNNFEHQVSLSKGKNVITFELSNKRGLSTRFEREIYFDNEPPELISNNIRSEESGSTEIFIVNITAKDNLSLKRTAQLNYELGGNSLTTFLRLNSASKVYEGSIQIPANIKSSFKVVSVLLEDHLGNNKKYPL